MHPLSENTKQSILALLQQGQSTRKIAEKCSVGKSTVQNLRKKFLPGLIKSRGGRVKKLSTQDKHYCVRTISSGRVKNAAALARKLKEDLGVDVSSWTVRRTLREAGMTAAEKKKKPKLSQANIKARLNFARKHKNWTVADWKRVIWSDETKINRYNSDGRAWFWKRDRESEQPRHVKETVKFGGGSIMIWGCMTAQGPGYMCRIDGRMDQHLYKSILEENLPKTMNWYKINVQKVIFQQDNDPKHKAKMVQEWLNTQPFEVLEWPAQSPDLNPIEHLWAHLKRRLNEYGEPPSGMVELWERVEIEWEKITKEICIKLIESMPKRIDAVLKAKGRWTKY